MLVPEGFGYQAKQQRKKRILSLPLFSYQPFYPREQLTFGSRQKNNLFSATKKPRDAPVIFEVNPEIAAAIADFCTQIFLSQKITFIFF
jgi:hypothetical protein